MTFSAIIPLFFGMRGWQLIVVVLVVILLFGTAKIPSMMRNLGKGVHAFKQGIEDAKEEMNREVKKYDQDGPKEDEKQ